MDRNPHKHLIEKVGKANPDLHGELGWIAAWASLGSGLSGKRSRFERMTTRDSQGYCLAMVVAIDRFKHGNGAELNPLKEKGRVHEARMNSPLEVSIKE